MSVLKPMLLEGRAIALAGGVPEAAKRALATLGARVEPAPLDELLGRDENRVVRTLAQTPPFNLFT
jgi:hypothetical protein